jgi:hypothetical protein
MGVRCLPKESLEVGIDLEPLMSRCTVIKKDSSFPASMASMAAAVAAHPI